MKKKNIPVKYRELKVCIPDEDEIKHMNIYQEPPKIKTHKIVRQTKHTSFSSYRIKCSIM